MIHPELELNDEKREALGVAYGMGVDSTAALVGMVERDIRPDFILFADVGNEKASTYEYYSVINTYLLKHNFPTVTVVRYKPKRAPYTTLEGNMVMNATLPGATFNLGSCTQKFKIEPQKKFEKKHFRGHMITKIIGFESGEEYRKKRANDRAYAKTEKNYKNWYPLQEWGWNREECKARIAEAGLPVPEKSACFFCPNMKPDEVRALSSEERGRIMRIEIMAEPYNNKVEGLWRRKRKNDGRPGSITEFILNEGLDYVHPDNLDWMPLNTNCLKSKRGFTFRKPHKDLMLADLVGGCECAKIENHLHLHLTDKVFEEVI